ncbi:MAG: TIGR00296 family protein [Thermoplasmata archaeon HGW-Thermoplasmata-2]|nr:MAG: TIGR00296 family protein [Thermoplasmata archaeon HGW-Thermoplasmata-2]
MYTLDDGKFAVKTARSVIESFVLRSSFLVSPPGAVWKQKSGVFVTILTYPEKELRGCIGIPEPVMPLMDALKEAAQSATRDPRFPPLEKSELDGIIIEVSILTPPELVKVKSAKDYLKEIKIGRDGLIAEHGWRRGLLLPQVPVEWKWNADEFLSETCMKAGLAPDAWLGNGFKLYKFQAEIFGEKSPRMEIERKEIC